MTNLFHVKKPQKELKEALQAADQDGAVILYTDDGCYRLERVTPQSPLSEEDQKAVIAAGIFTKYSEAFEKLAKM